MSKIGLGAKVVSLAFTAMLIAGPALAGTPVVDTSNGIKLPEPGMLGLFAAGVVAVILLKHRNRK